MVYRFTLAAITVALTLTGCAKISTGAQPVANNFTTGPAQVSISHLASRTDDGSTIIVTVDGDDAAPLVRGKTTDLYLTAGKHKVGGYVPTLQGFGRVTIQPIEITAATGEVKHVTYSVLKNKPTFAEAAATPVPSAPKAQTAAASATTSTASVTVANATSVTSTATAASTIPATISTATPVSSTPANTAAATNTTGTDSAASTAKAADTNSATSSTTQTESTATTASTSSQG